MVLSITTFATVSRRSFVIIALFSSIGLVSVIWCTKTAASTAAAESASITWHGLFVNPICANEVGKLDFVKAFFTFLFIDSDACIGPVIEAGSSSISRKRLILWMISLYASSIYFYGSSSLTCSALSHVYEKHPQALFGASDNFVP